MTTITSQQYIAQQIESYYDSNNYLKIEEIITAISDYKDVLQYIPNEVLIQISTQFKYRYKYEEKSDEDVISIIINAIKNNKYIMEVSGDIPTEFDDGVENAYFKFKFDITISDKKTKKTLLSIYGSGEGHHYVCGSSNTEIETFDISIYHYCKTEEEFDDVVSYLQDNWDIYDAEFGDDNVLECRDFEEVFEQLDDPKCFKKNYYGDDIELVNNDSASLEEEDASASEAEEDEDTIMVDTEEEEDEDTIMVDTEEAEGTIHVSFDINFNLNETMDRISEALDITFDSYGGYLSDDKQFEIWFGDDGSSSGGIWFKKLDYKFISSIVEPLFEALELNKQHKTYTIEMENYNDENSTNLDDIEVPLICYSTAKEKEKHQYLISISEINNAIPFLKQTLGYDNLTNIKKEYLNYIFNILKDELNREKREITIEEIEKVYNYDFKYEYTKCNPRWQSHVFIDEQWTLLTVTLEEIKDYFESQI